jgi:uncharacterized protein (TIGR02117 family)
VIKKRTAAIALAGALIVWWASGFAPSVRAPAATPGDCVEIGVWNNGFHTSLSLPAETLATDHPLRRLYPRARYLLIGWGDSRFYRSNGSDLWAGFLALAAGGETTVHLYASDAPPEENFLPKNTQRVAISRAGAIALGARLQQSLALDAAGAAQIQAPGQAPGQSHFLKGADQFHLFQVCNQWTARTLRAAGVPINAAFLYMGDWLVAAVKKKAPESCAALR